MRGADLFPQLLFGHSHVAAVAKLRLRLFGGYAEGLFIVLAIGTYGRSALAVLHPPLYGFGFLCGTFYDAGGAQYGFGALHYLFWHDAVLHVILYLLVAMAVGDVYGTLHGARDGVAVEDGLAVHVACRAPYGLYQRAVAAQKALFVGIEDGDEAHLRQVQTFAQQVDAHQHVEDPHAQVAHYLHTFQRVYVAVYVFALDAEVGEV